MGIVPAEKQYGHHESSKGVTLDIHAEPAPIYPSPRRLFFPRQLIAFPSASRLVLDSLAGLIPRTSLGFVLKLVWIQLIFFFLISSI